MKKFNQWLLDNHQMTPEVFEEKDHETKAGLFLKFNDYINDEHEKALKAVAESKEETEKLNKEFAKYKDSVIENQLKSINSTLRAQGIEMKRMKDLGNSIGANESGREQLRKALVANSAKLKALKDGQKAEVKANEFDIEIKAAGTMTSANISGGNVPVEDRLTGFNTIPSRRIKMLDVLSKRATSSNLVSWVYQANKDGSAGQTAEGTLKNQIDFDFVVDSEGLKKTTAFIKISTEMIDDIEWVMSEVENELMRELLKAVEAQVYEGDGTGQNLNGIRTVATAFAAGSFAGAVDNANEVDVLRVAMNQIEIAEQDESTAIFMHPSDLTALKMVKVDATDRRYVRVLEEIAANRSVDGVPIVTTTLVTQGEYLIGNFDKSLLVTKGGVRIDIGLDADDFTKNLRTVLAEWRGLVIVKQNDRTAFIKGDFATDKAALETT